ncbi:beta-1,3-glucosyltransferase [alpha proteobacterium U9-1i]|nr:beta-1,3-glucosyltransferase [alpha proteobacterium U9-1i]
MARTEDPRIAVVIAAYNAALTLERAVRSALAQPETSEIIVVDDASTDVTAALTESLAKADPRVRLIRQSRNAGPAHARNAALNVATAPWIAILDADDYLAPGRFAALLTNAGDADFIADTLIRIPDGAPTPAFTPDPRVLGPISFEHFVLGNMGALKGPLDLGFVKPIFRRAFVEQHGMRYADMRLGEDYEFYARALALGARFLMIGAAGYFRPSAKAHFRRTIPNATFRRFAIAIAASLRSARSASPNGARWISMRRAWIVACNGGA